MPAAMNRRLVAAVLAFLAMAAAACEEAPATHLPSSPNASTGAVGQATASCPTASTGEVALAPAAEPPVPADPDAAQGGEDEFNEGQPPEVPVDPNSVDPDRADFDATVIPARGAQGDPDPADLILYGDRAGKLENLYSHQTAEPEVAVKGDRVLLTWNAMAARSLDGGQSWQWLNPATQFPAVDDGFCCDQRAIHIPRLDLWLWVLQYYAEPNESNTIRLAWAVGDQAFDQGAFRYTDWKPPDLGLADGLFLDQPKLGVSDGNFFLSINAFDGPFQTAVVIRGSLQDLVAGTRVNATCIRPVDPDSGDPLFGPYPVRSAGDTMYLAAHVSTSELGVWAWPDVAGGPTFHRVRSFDALGNPVHYPRNSPYTCPRTGLGLQTDWCYRPVAKDKPDDPDRPGNDARITSGWVGNGTIGFAWNASQGAGFTYPFVWVLILDPARLAACTAGECEVARPHILSDQVAFQYAAISAAPDGSLGGMVMYGGGAFYLGCAAVARSAGAAAGAGWDLVSVANSAADMPTPNSGDYLGVTADGHATNGWAGTCMTWDPKLTETRGGTVIHFARFGRRADAP